VSPVISFYTLVHCPSGFGFGRCANVLALRVVVRRDSDI
jgi:hypothetical protein